MFLTRTLLDYDVNTDPFPLLASAERGDLNKARLTVLATNGTGSDVTLEGIIVELPVGDGAPELTFVPSAIEPVVPDNWTYSSQTTPNLVQFAFHPKDGHATLAARASLAFVFKNIEVNRQAGTFALPITEGSGNCVPPDCPVYTKHVSKFPNGWGQVSFLPKPANIPYQGSTTLHWTGPQGATYAIEYMANGRVVNIPKPGEPPLLNRGQFPGDDQPPLKLDTTTAFTLFVSQRIDNDQLEDGKQVTVTVGPPPPPIPKISKFHGSVAMDRSQLQLTLSWVTEGAKEITITDVPGVQTASGEWVVRPSLSAPLRSSYTLTATNGQNKVTSTITFIWNESKRVPVGEYPMSCAILPNGSRLFCTSYLENKVWALDPVTLTNLSGSPFRSFRAYSVTPSNDDAGLYVIEGPPDCKLSGYDPVTFKAVPGSPAATGTVHLHLAVTPDNKRIYVSGGLDREVLVFDASGLKLVKKIDPGDRPSGIAFTKKGERAFVAAGNFVSVIDTEKLTVITTIATRFLGAADVAVTPDGKQLYVANFSGSSVSVFDPDTYQPLSNSPIGVQGNPRRIEPSRDGRLMFVLSNSRLNIIDTATRTLLGSAKTGGFDVTSLAVSPDGIRVFATVRPSLDQNEMWMFLPCATGGIG